MVEGSCPRCGAVLEPEPRFCHNCGLDLEATPTPVAGPPQVPPPPLGPMYGQPGPWGFYPPAEPPVRPFDHHRALAGMGSVMSFFVAAMLIIPGLFFLIDSVTYEWDEWDDTETRVIRWDYVLVGSFTLASFGLGVAGGVSCAKATRFNLALAAGIAMLISALLFPAQSWDGWDWDDYEWTLAFYPILAGFALGLILLAYPCFTEPPKWSWPGSALPSTTDGYGRGQEGSP